MSGAASKLLAVCLLACLFSVSHAKRLDPHFSDVTITCDSTGVEISVNSTALSESVPGLHAESVRVGRGPWLRQCQPENAETGSRGLRIFKFKYGDCHPHVEELTNTQLRLTYELTGDIEDYQEDDVEGAAVSCFVPKDGLIGAKIQGHTNVYEYVGSPKGTFEFGMTLYKDSFMTVPVDPDEDIPLGVPLWVGLKLNSSSNSEMFVRDCWATSSPTRTTDQPEHMFIKNGLIGEDDETFSPVDDVITAKTYGFSFDSFMFRGAGNRVYIKCHVHVCDPYVAMTETSACSIPKYPEFHIAAREILSGSGSGSGFGLSLNTRDVADPEEFQGTEEQDEEAEVTENLEEDIEERALEEDNELEEKESDMEHSVFYVMHSFKVRHAERKRRSANSYRIYPRHTMFTNLRSGITLGIIITATAMFSACAILLPLHLSGEKVRCLQIKPIKRMI